MAEDFKSVKGRALHVYGDVLNPELLQRANEAVQTEFGAVDILINAAGGFKARFGTPGQFVWHCHIVEHEDNEMMQPYRIGPAALNAPGGGL